MYVLYHRFITSLECAQSFLHYHATYVSVFA